MATYLNYTCPVCNNSHGEEEQFCSSCGWVLMLPFSIVADPDTQFSAAENESLKLRQNSWQKLQDHLSQVSQSEEEMVFLKNETLELETSISLNQEKINVFDEKIEQLSKEIKQLEESVALKKKTFQMNSKPTYWNADESILPKIREKQAEIIDINSQILLPRTINLIFNNFDDLTKYRKRFPPPKLVLGIHQKQNIYVVTQAEFVYKLPAELVSRKVWINGYPALNIQLPFDLHSGHYYVLSNYSCVESFRSEIFFRIGLLEMIEGEI